MTEQRSRGEYHRADPSYRRQMKLLLAATVVGGAVGVVLLHSWLNKLGANAANGNLLVYSQWLNRLLAGLCLMLGITAAGFAQWLYRAARQSQSERRWPPTSMRTSADVRIRYLTSADALVSQFKAAAAGLGLLAAILCGWAIWLLMVS